MSRVSNNEPVYIYVTGIRMSPTNIPADDDVTKTAGQQYAGSARSDQRREWHRWQQQRREWSSRRRPVRNKLQGVRDDTAADGHTGPLLAALHDLQLLIHSHQPGHGARRVHPRQVQSGRLSADARLLHGPHHIRDTDAGDPAGLPSAGGRRHAVLD